jgi:4-hydroxymandelate oxidase
MLSTTSEPGAASIRRNRASNPTTTKCEIGASRGVIDLQELFDISEFEELADQRLPEYLRSWIQCEGDDVALRDSVLAWRSWALRSKALVNVESRDTSTVVLGRRLAAPILIAPFAGAALCDEDAELGLARSAADAGTTLVLSMAATRGPEEVGALGCDFWMQLYWLRDRGILEDVVRRAAASGATALCLTVDLPVIPSWSATTRRVMYKAREALGNGFVNDGYQQRFSDDIVDPSVTWSDLEWLAGITTLPLVLKGVSRGSDVILAREHGVSAVIVSSHGGHGFPAAAAPAVLLPAIVDIADGIEVLVDGGIRSGTDVLCALALGAKAVLIGRPAIWGLTVGGTDGVTRVLTLIRQELASAMGFIGATKTTDIDKTSLVSRNSSPDISVAPQGL